MVYGKSTTLGHSLPGITGLSKYPGKYMYQEPLTSSPPTFSKNGEYRSPLLNAFGTKKTKFGVHGKSTTLGHSLPGIAGLKEYPGKYMYQDALTSKRGFRFSQLRPMIQGNLGSGREQLHTHHHKHFTRPSIPSTRTPIKFPGDIEVMPKQYIKVGNKIFNVGSSGITGVDNKGNPAKLVISNIGPKNINLRPQDFKGKERRIPIHIFAKLNMGSAFGYRRANKYGGNNNIRRNNRGNKYGSNRNMCENLSLRRPGGSNSVTKARLIRELLNWIIITKSIYVPEVEINGRERPNPIALNDFYVELIADLIGLQDGRPRVGQRWAPMTGARRRMFPKPEFDNNMRKKILGVFSSMLLCSMVKGTTATDESDNCRDVMLDDGWGVNTPTRWRGSAGKRRMINIIMQSPYLVPTPEFPRSNRDFANVLMENLLSPAIERQPGYLNNYLQVSEWEFDREVTPGLAGISTFRGFLKLFNREQLCLIAHNLRTLIFSEYPLVLEDSYMVEMMSAFYPMTQPHERQALEFFRERSGRSGGNVLSYEQYMTSTQNPSSFGTKITRIKRKSRKY